MRKINKYYFSSSLFTVFEIFIAVTKLDESREKFWRKNSHTLFLCKYFLIKE
jgi:hypothetical protein